MGHCTLWIKWLFSTWYRQVTTHVKKGWAYRNLPRDIQQGQMLSSAPWTDKLPGRWHSLGHSSAEKDLSGLAKHEPAVRPCSNNSWQHTGLSMGTQAADWGMQLYHPMQHSQDHRHSTVPSLGFASTRQTSVNWSAFSRRPPRWSWAGTLAL